MTVERKVRRVDEAETLGPDGQALRKRILLEPGHWAEFDPFLLLAEDWFDAEGGFPDHPHRGFETVTLVLGGEVEHRDSRGNHGVLGSGDVQWMTAGRGVIHSELARPGTTAHTLQLWLNLPRERKLTEPRYQDLRFDAAPVRREPGVIVRVFSGKSGDVVASTLNHVPVTMIELRAEPSRTFVQELPAGYNGFVYVIAGEGRIGSENHRVAAGQLAWLERADEVSTLSLSAEGNSELRAVLIAGAPLNEPVVAYGPFVMSSQAEIVQAFADYRMGRFTQPTSG